jgi:hypothetical protein
MLDFIHTDTIYTTNIAIPILAYQQNKAVIYLHFIYTSLSQINPAKKKELSHALKQLLKIFLDF